MGPRSVEIIRRPVALLIVASLVVAACDSGDGADRAVGATDPADAPPAATSVTSATTTTVTVAAASTIGASPSTTAPAIAFPTEAFARISDKPVTADLAAQFQADLGIMAGDGGMTATVMTADGTWSGAAGTADGSRPVQVDDQFAIGSVTKSVVAAQVMQLVEAGELSLDDRAADRLPADFDFDTNGATIRQLLNHQSGLRNADTVLFELVRTDRQHVWTTAEVLDLAGDPLWPVGSRFEYSNANYFLLGAIIEQARGRPLAQVLRDGVLAGDGLERLVYQPDERPSEPMAMPAGESPAAFEVGGGYLPSIASATGGGPAAAMASDSPSLARWWRAFCAGDIVSQNSLTEMATAPLAGTPSLGEDYGLGLFQVADPYAKAVGHAGADIGFSSWAGCLPEQGAVVVVLTNREKDDIGGMASPLVAALQRG